MSPSLDWRGVIVPLTTPFAEDESVDLEAFSRQIEWMLAEGVHGVVVGGSTGEGFALDEDEVLALTRRALEVVRGRVPVMTSIMADSTRAAVRRARRLAELPISGLQVAPPHYIFSPDDDGLLDFYRQIGAATPLPIVIYNVISWANVSPATAARIMAEVPSVQAVKQSDKDLGTFADLVLAVGPERVFGAIDGSLMSCYDLGVAGSIAAIASAAPGASVKLWEAVSSGRREDALALNRKLGLLWQQLASSNLPARVKAAQASQGLSSGLARSPMAQPRREVRDAIGAALAELL
ncbi:MAG TPA: dihydrodipicolinate synthase family protein [Bosea sp. (in: a-proteobacteria)]|uniref:dihydrodipicolinate synthase family protein n=1 Tax=Bosea sp. (in: a-proteobacteria) TaxID=1871050 RepID=UPI002E0D4A93|nr:dihydrodipicolinate synthase family protein [Bosea sp. (in: a-proteobacteria)]